MLLEIIVLICVLGVNSSRKDVIHISIDDNNKANVIKDKNKNIRIEISKAKNQSHENFVPDESYEHFNLGNQYQKKSHINSRNSHEEDQWHGGKILSSIEETNNLWEETHKNHMINKYEPKTDHIFVDSILNSYENKRNIPPIYARKDVDRESRKFTKTNTETEKVSKSDESQEENTEIQDDRDDSADPSEENKCQLNVNEYADIAKAPCSSNGGNLEYQARMNTEESDEQDYLADYSYSVSVQRKGSHYASGALVGERWVLSTAAEFYNVRETIKLFRMRLGSTDCKKGGLLTPIQSILVHPRFAHGSPHFDVAILRSAETVVTSYDTKPIAISKVATGKVVNGKFLATYWPRIVVKDVVIPQSAAERVKYNSMRVSTQKLVPFEECSRQLAAANASLDRNSLCLRPVKIHHSHCMPDAGAPIVARDGLWGITSGWVAPDCPSHTLPTVVTRVATGDVRNWIIQQIHL